MKNGSVQWNWFSRRPLWKKCYIWIFKLLKTFSKRWYGFSYNLKLLFTFIFNKWNPKLWVFSDIEFLGGPFDKNVPFCIFKLLKTLSYYYKIITNSRRLVRSFCQFLSFFIGPAIGHKNSKTKKFHFLAQLEVLEKLYPFQAS